MITTPAPGPTPATRAALTLAALAITSVLSGCASARPAGPATAAPPTVHRRSSTAVASTPASLSAPDLPGPDRYGQDAARLTALVPGCKRSVDLSHGAALVLAPALRLATTTLPAASSISTCTLRGAGVLILTFQSPAQQSQATQALARIESHYATGTGWLAVPTATADPVSGLSVVQDIAIALDGQLRSRSTQTSAG